jgi:very-short-patch-repair endonuclease
VFDLRGRLLGYPDLLDVESGLVGEYDGEDHRRSLRHSHDVGREALFRRHGLEVTRATSWDLRDRSALADRVLEARARSRFLPPGARSWTLTLPPDW